MLFSSIKFVLLSAFIMVITYYVYTRFIVVYITHRYYEKQGARKLPGCWPLIGNMGTIIGLV